MLHKDDTIGESIVGYAIGLFSFIIGNMPAIDNFFQHVALVCGAGVVITQLVINIRKLRGKGGAP